MSFEHYRIYVIVLALLLFGGVGVWAALTRPPYDGRRRDLYARHHIGMRAGPWRALTWGFTVLTMLPIVPGAYAEYGLVRGVGTLIVAAVALNVFIPFIMLYGRR